jgi:hypothetical protein
MSRAAAQSDKFDQYLMGKNAEIQLAQSPVVEICSSQ